VVFTTFSIHEEFNPRASFRSTVYQHLVACCGGHCGVMVMSACPPLPWLQLVMYIELKNGSNLNTTPESE
jgi:hypothetical protein